MSYVLSYLPYMTDKNQDEIGTIDMEYSYLKDALIKARDLYINNEAEEIKYRKRGDKWNLLYREVNGKAETINHLITICSVPEITYVEHSRLVYLLDALRSAPHKAQDLLRLAKENNSTSLYGMLLNQLQMALEDPIALREVGDKIRNSIRLGLKVNAEI